MRSSLRDQDVSSRLLRAKDDLPEALVVGFSTKLHVAVAGPETVR
jgi:hypothetical protein